MITPFYSDQVVTIYQGDALDVLLELEAESFGTLVADPPYCSGGRQQSGARNTVTKNACRDDRDWILTDNMGTDTYLWWLRQLGRRLFRVAEIGAHFYCFTDWRQYGGLVTALETTGWSLRSCVVWSKNRGGALGSFWRNDHELIAVFSKGMPAGLPAGDFFNVLTATKPQGSDHPTEKPLAVVKRLVEAGPGRVLDPCLGSGTTLWASKELGRVAVGIELEARWCQLSADRCRQGVLDL